MLPQLPVSVVVQKLRFLVLEDSCWFWAPSEQTQSFYGLKVQALSLATVGNRGSAILKI